MIIRITIFHAFRDVHSSVNVLNLRHPSCPSSTEVTSLVSHTATYHAQHQGTLIGAFSSTVHGSENNFLPCFIESNVVLSTPRSWESKASTSPCTKPSPGRAYHQLWRASPLYKLCTIRLIKFSSSIVSITPSNRHSHNKVLDP